MQRLSNEEYYARMDKVKARLKEVQDDLEQFMADNDCRIQGDFRLYDVRSKIYLKVRMS